MSKTCFLDKIRLVISYELPAKQAIHMKCQVLFSLNSNVKKNTRMSSAKCLPSSLGVNCLWFFHILDQLFLALLTLKASITTVWQFFCVACIAWQTHRDHVHPHRRRWRQRRRGCHTFRFCSIIFEGMYWFHSSFAELYITIKYRLIRYWWSSAKFSLSYGPFLT